MKTKKIKKIIVIGLSTLMCVGSLSACSKEKKNPVQTASNDTLKQVLEINSVKCDKTADYQAYWGSKVQCITKGEHGYYYLTEEEPTYLMYFDENTEESIPVCGKAECNHDNADCNAFFGSKKFYDKTAVEQEYYSRAQLYYYKDMLYMLSSQGNLVAITPDGSERKKIAQVYAYDGSSDTKITFYDNYAYVYNSVGNMGSNSEHTETIERYSLDGKTQDTVVEWKVQSGAINSVKNYGDRMYFVTQSMQKEKTDTGISQKYSYDGLYAYDHKTGKSGTVIDAPVTSYAIDEENEKIYYFAYMDGLYEYDVLAKQSKKLLEANDDCGIAEISYDGKYLYLYNGEWVSYTKRNLGKEIKNECLVLDNSGNKVTEIEIGLYGFCMFGDSEYLFAQQSLDKENIMKLTYIKKSDISSKEWKELR